MRTYKSFFLISFCVEKTQSQESYREKKAQHVSDHPQRVHLEISVFSSVSHVQAQHKDLALRQNVANHLKRVT